MTDTEKMHTELSAAALKADLLDITLDELKCAAGPWDKLSADLQDAKLAALDARVSTAVTQALALFATAGVARINATLEQISVKKSIELKLAVGRHEPARADLLEAQGQTVWIVLANPDAFADAPSGHSATSDQRALPLEDGHESD